MITTVDGKEVKKVLYNGKEVKRIGIIKNNNFTTVWTKSGETVTKSNVISFSGVTGTIGYSQIEGGSVYTTNALSRIITDGDGVVTEIISVEPITDNVTSLTNSGTTISLKLTSDQPSTKVEGRIEVNYKVQYS